jgi:PhnB protein
MKALQTYLNFDGDTRQAITFYHGCLGGELIMQTFKDAKMDVPKGAEDRILHARLMNKGAAMLMASDTMPGMPFTPGNNFSINIECDDVSEEERIFTALAEGGKVTMPLQDTFWGARFGMLIDKFGVSWMLNCELPKKQ